MPLTILNRTLFEWQLAFFSLVVGSTLLFFGDRRLGMYFLNVPGFESHVNCVIWTWSCVLWACGIFQVYALVDCVRKAYFGADCVDCPLKEICFVVTLRRWAAGISAIVWTALGCTFYSGHYFGIGLPTATIVTISQFLVFTLMSKR